MAKKSRKRLQRSGKDPGGCLSGLINMFDFRQGHSSAKLLSARKSRSGLEFGENYSEAEVKPPSNFESFKEISGVDDSGEESTHAVIKGVESLVEGDISRVNLSKKIPNEEIELLPPETGPEFHFQNKYKLASQRHKGVSDLVNRLKEYTSLESQKENGMDSTEKSSLDFDLAAFMTNFRLGECQLKHLGYEGEDDLYDVSKTIDRGIDNHSEGLDFELVEKQVMLHKSLVDVANVFGSQNFSNSKLHRVDLQPQEFMEALEILNTNKQLLLSLLQDPDSLLLKLVHDHQNAQVGKPSDIESGNSLTIEVAEGIDSSEKREECFTANMLNKQRGYKLFRRKEDKPKREKLSEMSDSSNTLDKIVILKPRHSSIQNPSIAAGPSSSPVSHDNLLFQEDQEKVATHFSLKDIKRRLQNVIGSSRRARHVISMEGVMHRIPYESKESASLGKDTAPYALPNKAYYGSEECSSSPSALRKRDEKDNPEDNFVVSGNDRRLNNAVSGHLVNREYIDEEAKKHLACMLDSCRDDSDLLHTRGLSKSLGRLLYQQEYDISSRSTSPKKDRGTLSPTEVYEEGVLTTNQLSPLMSHLETMPCTNEHPNEEADVVDIASEPTHTQTSEKTSIIEENQKESKEIVEADIISNEECGPVSAESESDCFVSGGVTERCTEDISPVYSGREVINIENHGSAQDTSPATPPSSKPCRSLLKQIFKDRDGSLDMSEHPSPVSVLEPLFDGNSYGSEQDESPISPRTSLPVEDYANADPPLIPAASEDNLQHGIHDCADIFEYVKVVLERSRLNGNEISNRWLSSDHLIDPSLVNEVGISCSQFDDPQLLFDCTSEAIMELQERVFSCAPWVSRLKLNVRPIPVNNNLIQEVYKAIERHLSWQSPRALDQIISEDMDSRTWLEVQSDTESIVIETGDFILEELIWEAAFELWI